MYKVISFYQFTPLNNLNDLRAVLFEMAEQLEIKGTILIAEEGINGGLAGSDEAIELFKEKINSLKMFGTLTFKDSEYNQESFRRLLVKIKKEIITMRQPIDPHKTGKYLDPQTFLQWQREGKKMKVLDTRNDYEVAAGTFRNAINPKISTFSQFPGWVDQNLSQDKEETIVTFCTGGIRCEKATAYMQEQGFQEVYQIDGGVLKYFEETISDDDNFWDGECIVFDKRKAVTKDLQATSNTHCFVCLARIDQSIPEFIHEAGEACPSCHEKMMINQQLRTEKGLQKQEVQKEKRRVFLAEMQQKYSHV